jgi:hypothetical protein
LSTSLAAFETLGEAPLVELVEGMDYGHEDEKFSRKLKGDIGVNRKS